MAYHNCSQSHRCARQRNFRRTATHRPLASAVVFTRVFIGQCIVSCIQLTNIILQKLDSEQLGSKISSYELPAIISCSVFNFQWHCHIFNLVELESAENQSLGIRFIIPLGERHQSLHRQQHAKSVSRLCTHGKRFIPEFYIRLVCFAYTADGQHNSSRAIPGRLFLILGKNWLRLGAIGGIIFLLAIMPLGVGSGFPCPLFLAIALFLVYRAFTVQQHAKYEMKKASLL